MLKLLPYTFFAITLVVLGLCFARKYIKKEESRDLLFITLSIATVVVHYSSIVYELISGQRVEIIDTYYLPVYPCNIIMWQALVLSILMMKGKKDKKLFEVLSSATLCVGSLCVFVGIAFNTNFLNTQDYSDFEIAKGLISHTTLLFDCLYLYIGGYVEIKGIENFKTVIIQALIFLVCGIYSNIMDKLISNNDVNSMFLERPPFESLPFINVYVVVPIIALLYLIFFTIVEKKKKKRWNIWYNKLKVKK